MRTVTQAIRERLRSLELEEAILAARRKGVEEALELAEAVVSGNALDAPSRTATQLPSSPSEPSSRPPKALPAAKTTPAKKPRAKRTSAKKPKGTPAAKLSKTATDILQALEASPDSRFTARQLFDAIWEVQGKSVENVRMAANRLVKKRLARRPDKGLYQAKGGRHG